MKEAKTKEQVALEKKEENMLIERIQEISSRVPSSHNKWSYQRSLAFKDSVRRANSEVNKKRKSLDGLRAAVVDLVSFYTEQA